MIDNSNTKKPTAAAAAAKSKPAQTKATDEKADPEHWIFEPSIRATKKDVLEGPKMAHERDKAIIAERACGAGRSAATGKGGVFDMARIDDFGEKIEGAAKDRFQQYRDRLRAVTGSEAIRGRHLSESFPEPSYKTLLKDGAAPETVAFVRAARDQVSSKPRNADKLARWITEVETLRGLCEDLMEGLASVDDLRDRMRELGYQGLADQINSRMELYLALGHEKSMKGYKLRVRTDRCDGDQVFDPPVQRWMVSKESKTWVGRILVEGETKEAAIEAFRVMIDNGVSLKKRPNIRVFTYRGRPEKGSIIGQKNGRELLEIENHDTVEEARERLRDNRDEIEEKLRRLKDIPPERIGENAERSGPARRTGDVTPETFMETFGMRGVQFGNYVEGARRQKELNETHDALMDLSDVLGCHPSVLSLDGKLGLAFGARGRGGAGAAKAHYEPGEIVINLTKANGAGSLAHEWFHALDNHVARRHDKVHHRFASASCEGRIFTQFLNDIREKTGVVDRSRELDKTRSSPYFATAIEVTARSFETWVVDRLSRKGARNDYLANFAEEEVFEAESKLRGQLGGRYPYPRGSEIPVIREAFDDLFARPELNACSASSSRLFFLHGFAKSAKADVTPKETAALRTNAGVLLGLSGQQLKQLEIRGDLIAVRRMK